MKIYNGILILIKLRTKRMRNFLEIKYAYVWSDIITSNKASATGNNKSINYVWRFPRPLTLTSWRNEKGGRLFGYWHRSRVSWYIFAMFDTVDNLFINTWIIFKGYLFVHVLLSASRIFLLPLSLSLFRFPSPASCFGNGQFLFFMHPLPSSVQPLLLSYIAAPCDARYRKQSNFDFNLPCCRPREGCIVHSFAHRNYHPYRLPINSSIILFFIFQHISSMEKNFVPINREPNPKPFGSSVPWIYL